MSLEKLFQQIIESEQTSESRREGITQAKKKISTCEMEIRAMTESCSSMRCKVKILSSRLQDEQAERLVLQEQSRVLKNKKAEIKKSIESLQGVLNDSRLQFHDKQSDYCKRVVSFCSDYDLTSDRCKRTKGEMKQDKGELEQKKRQLMNELEDLNSKEERISEILAQRVCSQADISELRSLIEMEDKKSSEMRREFHEIAQKFSKVTKAQYNSTSNPELLNIQRELDSIKNYQLEKTVLGLRGELSIAKQTKGCQSSAEKSKTFKFYQPKKLA